MKRGQITLFVILGIVLIALVGGAYYLSQQFAKAKSITELAEAAELSEAELEAKNVVESCMEDLLSNGILEVFSAGGGLSKKKVRAAGLTIPVYEKELPKLDQILKNVAVYIDDNIGNCLAANSPGLKVRRAGDSKVKAEGNKVNAISDIEIIVSENSILKDFSSSIDADLEKAIEDANELYNQEKETGRFVAMGNTSLNSLKKDYLLYTESTGKEKVYILSFKRVIIDRRQLEFAFAMPIEHRTIVAGINITEIDTGIFARIATTVEEIFEGGEV